jgi:hypothetical protein
MRKRQADRRSDRKSRRGSPPARRKAPERRESDRNPSTPAAGLPDLDVTGPSAHRGRDILEDERSDRESGRPLRLEEDTGTALPGRGDRSDLRRKAYDEEGAG